MRIQEFGGLQLPWKEINLPTPGIRKGVLTASRNI